jgi:hypothetical protein
MVRLAADGAGDWESRGASPSMVESEAEDCIIVSFVISWATYVLFGFFVLSMGLDWKNNRGLKAGVRS